MKSVALIHIAAHGDSKFGEIALAPNPERTSQIPEKEDFMLAMSDVHAVGLQARLVVLSSCHSGRGKVNSEGVVGIARAFLCAGARSVLVSLWAIDDEATLLFMKSFYQHLADRKSASLALHHAMKSLRETKEYSAIKYWAPFVLIGDDVSFEFGPQELEKNEKSSES
ncbi:tetratricopeptide repeat protein 28-like [Montipora capricornis]|uniref:tetratricopeptide repeat protein 28-like n=1 Tax=Montipora capricornis TaxID=246305 RepID=UPI0035F13795